MTVLDLWAKSSWFSPEIPIWRVRWVRGLPLPRGEVDPEPDERRGGEIHGFASTKKVGLMRLVRFITTQKIEVRKILCAKMLGIITVLPFFSGITICMYIYNILVTTGARLQTGQDSNLQNAKLMKAVNIGKL